MSKELQSEKHCLSKKVRGIILTFVILIIIAGISLGVLFGLDVREFSINDEDLFVKAILHSSEIKQSKIYKITKDFEVHVSKIPKDKDFYGTLDGQGHTITIVADSDEKSLESLSHPIFNNIIKDAVVKRINLDVKVPICSDSDKNDIALLAHANMGTIANCSIKIEKVHLEDECLNAAGLVNFNFNEIANICLSVNSVDVSNNSIANWKCRFGALATVNYAKVNDVFLDVSFGAGIEDKLIVFDNKYDNRYVGYVFGGFPIHTNADSVVIKNIYLFDGSNFNFMFWSKMCDTQNYGEHYKKCTYSDMTEEFFSNISDENGEWRNNWRFVNPNNFPVLKTA